MNEDRDLLLELDLDQSSPTPIYAQIVDGIIGFLVRSGANSGRRLPPERGFAEKHGISRGTVRKAYALLREQGLVEPVNGDGRLVVSPRLAEKRLETLPPCVGIVLLHPLGNFIGRYEWRALDYLAGVVDASSEAGYSVTFVSLPEDWASPEEMTRWYAHLCSNVCGVIHFGIKRVGSRIHLAQQRLFDDHSLPQVYLSGRTDSPTVASVHADYRTGYLPAVEHLCQMGHRRIGYIGGIPPARKVRGFQSSAAFREEAMRWALHQCGIRVRSDWTASGCLNPEDVEPAAKRILSSRPRPTAILCHNDEAAVRLVECVRRRGLTVPGDISVIGYDDSGPAEQCDPPLTTARQPRRAIARQCFQLLAECREEGRVLKNVEEVFPASLVVRASTGPPPGEAGEGE